MASYLQRLCWNSSGWTSPSGNKFGTENSYPGSYGFGHEEWNFNTADAVGGYVYGHIYRDYESLGHGTSPGPHDFYFWSRPSVSSPQLLVGMYRNAVFLPRLERELAIRSLEKSGALKRREEELLALGLPAKAIARMGSPLAALRQGGAASLRVRTGDVESFPNPVLLSVAFKGRPLPKLTRYYQIAKLDNGTFDLPLGSPLGPRRAGSQNGSNRVDYYLRQTAAESRLIIKHEEILRKKLEEFLKGSVPPPISESGHTDLIAERSGHICLMELKTCKHVPVKIAVRAAMGQLLYYSYHTKSGSQFATGTPPDSLCIVLDVSPDAETRDWVSDLSKRLSLKIDLAWIAGSKFAAAFGSTPFF